MSNLYRPGNQPVFSCELFPPKTEKAREGLLRELPALLKLPFRLVTCTHGAGGSRATRPAETLGLIRRFSSVSMAAHLCCRGASPKELRQLVEEARQQGADWIVALRGDRPECHEGLHYASELVEFLNREYSDMKVAVAGYPEVHPEAVCAQTDLGYLKQKVEAGADVVFTQFFFDNQGFFEFQDRCRQQGLKAPIVPGILPVSSLEQVQRLSERCGARVPESLITRLNQASDEAQAGLEFTTAQVTELLDRGVAGLHFYCLNKARVVNHIFSEIEKRCPGALPFVA